MFTSQNISLAVIVILSMYCAYRIFLLLKLSAEIEKSSNWVSVKAVVRDLRIYRKKEKVGGHIFKKDVAFLYATYSVGGREFGTSRINFHSYVSKLAMIKLSGHSVGGDIEIYADPERPHRSVFLRPIEHSTAYQWIMTIIPLLFVTFLILLRF